MPKSASIPPAKLESGLGTVPQPQLQLLTYSKQVKFEGLASLKTPDPLLIQYDESPFQTEFHEILAAARERCRLTFLWRKVQHHRRSVP